MSNTGIPINGITSDINLYGKEKTYVLTNGAKFNDLMPDSTTKVIFTYETMPSSATLIDVDEDGDGSIVAWMEESTMKISSQDKDKKIISSSVFSGLFSMKKI